MHTNASIPQMLMQTCRGLVKIENDKVSLVHQTAKEFLTRQATKWSSEMLTLRVELTDAHELYVNTCVESMADAGFEWFHQSEGIFLSQDLMYPPFFLYAFKFAAYHFNRIQNPKTATLARIEHFVNAHLASFIRDHHLLLFTRRAYGYDSARLFGSC